MGYVTGNLSNDAADIGRRGWVVGKFLIGDQEFPLHGTTDLEVKSWRCAAGEVPDHPTKVSTTTEWTYIISGSVMAEVGGDTFVLRAGDHILIHPGTTNNTVADVLEDVEGITFKAPSDPYAKRVRGVPTCEYMVSAQRTHDATS